MTMLIVTFLSFPNVRKIMYHGQYANPGTPTYE